MVGTQGLAEQQNPSFIADEVALRESLQRAGMCVLCHQSLVLMPRGPAKSSKRKDPEGVPGCRQVEAGAQDITFHAADSHTSRRLQRGDLGMAGYNQHIPRL